MSASPFHITSIGMNNSLLRTSGLQRLKYRSRMTVSASKGKVITPKTHAKSTSAVATYHDELRMQRAVARGVRREIICHLLITVIMTTAGILAYGLFF